MLTAHELHARGRALINAGRVRAARRPLETALVRCGDEALTGSIEVSLAYVEAETGDRGRALALCDSAARRAGLDTTTLGVVHSQRALLFMLTGRNVEALAEYDAAIGMLGTSASYLGHAHLNRGNLYLQQNDHDRAAEDFAAALEHHRAAGAAVEAAMDEHNLGYAHYLAGDLAAALRHMDAAREVLAPLSSVNEATCDQDRAEVLQAAGLAADARDALATAARAYGTARLRRRQAEAELALARALLLEDPRRARLAARAASRRFARAGAAALQTRADAVALNAEVGLGRTSASLLECGAEIQAALVREGCYHEARQLELGLARVEMQRRQPERARARLGKLRIGRRDPLAVRLLAADVRAELEAASGRPRTALGDLRRGLDELHEWQSSFGSLDLQTNVVGQGVRLAKRGLELAVASRSTAVLFEWSERARMLASRVQPVRAPRDEELADALAELRAQPAPDREGELRRRIRERAWQQSGSGQVTQPLSLSQLRDRLGGSALVAYVVTADRVVALVVTADGAVCHDLGARAVIEPLLGGLLADLDMAASDLPGPVTGAIRRGLDLRLGRLADVLVEPVLRDIGERPVVLTPAGVLAGVPWTLLEGYAGRPVNVAQSATSWVARRATPLRLANAGFVAGPRVERAEDEVVAAAKEWTDARVLTGASARTSAVSDLAEEVDVLHVAAHGRHSAENPLFSGVELVDGAWFGYDIDCLEQVPDVVILSACEVGRSSVRWGEELIGMSSAWLHAGARCVIASAAAVNDEAAYDTLLSLHGALAAGAEPATALATALRRRRPDTAPAPFVCFA